MREITIALENGDELTKHTEALHALVGEALGQTYGGLSIDSSGVRVQVADDIRDDHPDVAAAIEAIRAFVPPAEVSRSAARQIEPNLADVIAQANALQEQLYTMQQQLDVLYEAIDQLTNKKE